MAQGFFQPSGCRKQEKLSKTIEGFGGQPHVIEQTVQEALFDRAPRMDRHGHSTSIAGAPERQMASSLVGGCKAESLKDREQFASGQNRKFLTAHGGQER